MLHANAQAGAVVWQDRSTFSVCPDLEADRVGLSDGLAPRWSTFSVWPALEADRVGLSDVFVGLSVWPGGPRWPER